MISASVHATQITSVGATVAKLHEIERELNARFLERSEVIRGLLLAVLTRQHALIFGKHGAAKTDLVQALADAFVGGGLFRLQVGKDTTSDHIFGPIKISALQRDEQRRAFENFLPGSPFVFLDEIDKTNSIIQTSLYTPMEERLFTDNGQVQRIPLISLFGAANRIESLQTPELAPLFDRFLVRLEVNWIENDGNFLEFLRRVSEHDHPGISTSLNLLELQLLQQAVQQIKVPPATLESLTKLKKLLAQEGIFASTRRWSYLVHLVKASALLAGDGAVWEEHFAPLKLALWTDKKQIPVIDRVLKEFEVGQTQQVQDALKTAKRITEAVLKFTNPQQVLGQSTLAHQDLQQLHQELTALLSSASINKQRQVELNKALQTLTIQSDRIVAHRKQICNL
ncbi:MAG TPA: AAA family ATPase [Thermosynechococcaceae cyanobacterium]